jgi:hypothetical protein
MMRNDKWVGESECLKTFTLIDAPVVKQQLIIWAIEVCISTFCNIFKPISFTSAWFDINTSLELLDMLMNKKKLEQSLNLIYNLFLT